ncbi:MAG: site-2 protease family protein [Candidatus Parvarchaeota archaeon]|nr:site-2 protease family protein [Candidatus Parvarchaeota archaeon]MCW1301689.1 site-2 protease family protein [Candidatus Parvarchaeota archaeon]
MSLLSFVYSNENNIAALVLILIIIAFVVIYRRKFSVEGKVLFIYRSKLGLKLMKRLSKYKRAINVYSTVGVVAAFAAIAYMLYLLIPYISLMFNHPTTTLAAFYPVLPVEGIPGVLGVPVLYWLIAIIVLVAVHEASHGFVALSKKIRLKSSGFGFFLAFLPLAFVEPDEKQFERASRLNKLRVLSAGSFTNIIFGLVAFGLYILLSDFIVSAGLVTFAPLILHIGAAVAGPAYSMHLPQNLSVVKINGQFFYSAAQAISLMRDVQPGQYVNLTNASGSVYSIMSVFSTGINSSTHSYIGNFTGVYLTASKEQPLLLNPISSTAFPTSAFSSQILYWLDGLLLWFFLIGLGLGLANLLPIFYITDGCKIVNVALSYVVKDKKRLMAITNYIIIAFSIFVLFLTPLGSYIFSLIK